MSSAPRTRQPRIRRSELQEGPGERAWLCVGYGSYGHGATPFKAYQEWTWSEAHLRSLAGLPPITRPQPRHPTEATP